MSENHDAIIEPAVFDRVQDMIKERSQRKGYSGVTIFSSKIKCGCCGGWYGSKVWHSTDKYRRVIWQCNAKFKDKTGCKTPHLTEDEVKEAFISVCNRLIVDRSEILDDLKAAQAMLSGTAELETEQRRLAEQMNVDDDAVRQVISENARVAQNQEAYRIRYEALVSRFEETKARYDAVTEEIRMRGIRRREFGRFIAEVEKMGDKPIRKFDEALWGALVDHITVHAKDNIIFTLNSGTEIQA